MDSSVELFNHDDFGQLRTVIVDNEPWFVAADVCRALDLAKMTSVDLLDDDEKGTHTVDTPGGPQQMLIINEPGLYSLVLRSRKPEAKAFKRWLTHEVIPSIRKTGSYSVAPKWEIPQTYVEALRETLRLAIEVEAAERKNREQAITIRLQDSHIGALTPRAVSWDKLADAEGDYSLREAAQILNRDTSLVAKFGQNRLFAYLRGLRWLDRNSIPFQKYVDAGYVSLRTTAYTKKNGTECISQQVRLTAKGIQKLHEGLRPALDLSPLPVSS